jgi:hypothetical protein
MHVMGDILGDALEIVFKLLKRFVILLLQGVIEFVLEFVLERLVSTLERQQLFFYRITGTRWVSVPLALISFILMLASPIVLLVALLRLAGGA